MKILQVISSFPPAYAYGGPAKVAYDISKELVKRGHEVTVYTTDVLDSQSRLTYDENPMWMDGIEVHHFKNVSNKLASKNYAMAPMMALALNKSIKDFDVIHLQDFRTFQAVFVQKYAKKHGVPYVLQPRGTIPTDSKSNQKKTFDYFFGNSIIKNASKIIASSKFESDHYLDVFPNLKNKKIIHIPNGVDFKIYQNLPKKGEFKNKHSIDDEKLILFLSRIHEIKGADILIEAFSKLKNEFKSIKLVIAGPDEGYSDKLKQLTIKLDIESSVIFTGPLYEKDKLEAYVDADVFVLPSHYESFGNVVLEAMACGAPVIVTNNCGISEWIGVNAGYIIEYNANQLCDAIDEILSDELLKIKLSANGMNLVQKMFNLENIINMIEKTYCDAISDSK